MPYEEPMFRFKFHDAGDLAPPLISFSEVAFSYSGKPEDYLFKKVSFGIHPKSRICLVGPNGAGKSTLLKLIDGELGECEGAISRRSGMSIGRFHQHSAEILDYDKSPVDYIAGKYQKKYPSNRLEEWRAVVGNYGIPSEYHQEKISLLSDGLKTRLVFCEIALQKPHLLLFDEPTNAAGMSLPLLLSIIVALQLMSIHTLTTMSILTAASTSQSFYSYIYIYIYSHITYPTHHTHHALKWVNLFLCHIRVGIDMEMIDSMAEAIQSFNGGVLVISHDFRLLSKVADEIWVCDHGIKVFDGDIRDYKESLKKSFGYKKEEGGK